MRFRSERSLKVKTREIFSWKILCFYASLRSSLTAWPLVRDVFFYSVSLILLVAFFLDNQIEWWESLVLLSWYICYVTFMKFNDFAEGKIRQLLNLKPLVRIDDKYAVLECLK